jgi:heme A synthase
LLSVVALPLAAAHQAGAVALFATTLWTAHALRSRVEISVVRSDAVDTHPATLLLADQTPV